MFKPQISDQVPAGVVMFIWWYGFKASAVNAWRNQHKAGDVKGRRDVPVVDEAETDDGFPLEDAISGSYLSSCFLAAELRLLLLT